ncbi:MAG: HEPN domain-containing protein [Bacteroidota bacterium]|nr:DNA-binding protein [Odoribacter sp.]MDP3644391.1 HEPN domain-containing protein [Bacteroidota bacterium]
MTKAEHIIYWAKQVDEDFDCAKVLYQANHFAQSLFWAHLALEKLSKALWIKKNEGNTPPFVHNLLRLITQTNEYFSEEQLQFINEMNAFQIKGRYPDYAESLEKTITKEICNEYLSDTKKMIICLQGKLQ